MQLRVMVEPQQGATYEDLVGVAQRAERLGFEGFFRSDHLTSIGLDAAEPGSTETWVTLAGLARDTSRIRLGTLVTSATFRLPAILALTVATVDAMSGGRIELGLGAGWYELEHRAFAVPFPRAADRFDRLEEQLSIITGLWSTPPGENFSFDGKHYQVVDNPALPQPAQRPPPPIIVGGLGPRRTPHLAARFAAEYNAPPFSSLDDAAAGFARARQACEELGRDPASLTLSVAQSLLVGSPHDIKRHASLAALPPNPDRVALVGTVDQVIDRIGRFGDAGASRIYLQMLDIHDADQLELVAQQILPRVQLPSTMVNSSA
jgi:F420-dependent oxidoreductase-like protein